MDTQKDKKSIAYLVSCYPAVSHTFIQHEIEWLRHYGWNIRTASINDCNYAASIMDETVAKEEKETFYIKNKGARGAFSALMHFMFTQPIQLFKTWRYTRRYTRSTGQQFKFAIGYFAEGLIYARWLQENNLQYVHVHFGNAAAAVALVASCLHRCNLSLSIHGPDIFFDQYYQGLSHKLKMSQWIRCIGYFSQSQLFRLLPISEWHKVSIIPLGIDPSKLVFQQEKPLHTPVKILCVGRLTPAKGQSILLKACKKLIDDGYAVSVHYVGDGPDRPNLEAEAKQLRMESHVVFHGSKNHLQVIEFYKNSDIFCLPSFAEGIPIVLMEAMAMGVPCISTVINGIPELIRNEVDGLLVLPSDVPALAEAIKKLIDNPELRKKMCLSARERVVEKYDFPKNVQLLSDAFTNLQKAWEKVEAYR